MLRIGISHSRPTLALFQAQQLYNIKLLIIHLSCACFQVALIWSCTLSLLTDSVGVCTFTVLCAGPDLGFIIRNVWRGGQPMAFVCDCSNLNWHHLSVASGKGWVLQTTLACFMPTCSGFHAALNERPSHHSLSKGASGVEFPAAVLLLTGASTVHPAETANRSPEACHVPWSVCVLWF